MSETVETWRAELSPADAANLRRCSRARDALLVPATLDLIRRLDAWKWSHRAAALTIVLSHVKVDEARPIMRSCGRARMSDETALLSEARFRRLISIRDHDDLMSAMVRVVRLMGGTCSISDLTESLRWWNDRTRERWAVEYYAAFEPTETAEQES